MDKTGKEEDDLKAAMGFGEFGGKKKARTFDVTAMFEQSRRIAMERSQEQLEKREEEQKMVLLEKTKKGEPGDDNDDDDDDDDVVGPPLPPSHDKKSTQAGSSKGHVKCHTKSKTRESEDMIGPPLPPGMKVGGNKKHAADDDDDEEDDDGDDDSDNPLQKIPLSHEVKLCHGAKVVSALGLDPSGARLVTGGYDFEVKFWDFAGMDAALNSFRSIRPCESHNIKGLEYSTTGDVVLVISGNSQAKVIDRDGFEVFECAKGYPYIADMASTKGHTAMLNCGCWNPRVKEEFMTCSNDASVRLWDTNMEGMKHKYIMKPKNQTGKRTIPTACTFNRDGLYIAAACQDGSIQLWDHRKNFVNTAMLNRTAHMNGSDTSCLCFSYDGRVLASRGGDDTLKLWDIRNFKKPLCVAEDLYNRFPVTDCIFSPDDKLVVTGVSLRKGETDGKLIFLDRETLNKQKEIIVSESSVVRCLWHPRLNQMVVGTGDGDVKIYYDPDKSHRGAKLCVVKTKRKVKQAEVMASQNIITPYALPMFRQAKPTSTKKQEEKIRKDPVRSHRPDLPVSGPGSGGRLAAKGATLSQYVAQNLVLRKPDDRDKDPRAAILRHAKDAEQNPYWVTPAYGRTQPKPVFDTESDEEEGADDDEPAWKKKKVS